MNKRIIDNFEHGIEMAKRHGSRQNDIFVLNRLAKQCSVNRAAYYKGYLFERGY